MPELSPLMTSGRITRWHKQIGDRIDAYDLLYEVETNHLTVREDEVFTLDVEAHEDGYLGAILVQDGDEIDVGAPIAVVCDEEKDLEHFKDYKAPSEQEAAAAYEKRSFLWQAYTKSRNLDM
eukprot:CAMPEP_0118930430 /NCGR_PEP_ID=MMETSP1169-20130426/7124_1 /TAXON_ID=36882 /ORGANISM="Pyramimonas obovata, Strain CCMP722" /LENGTH=121 /DNA_ID=CAMNT_0006872787 /DNA_START=346 /DNA_END=711 /DNA_ORIENTATION=-